MHMWSAWQRGLFPVIYIGGGIANASPHIQFLVPIPRNGSTIHTVVQLKARSHSGFFSVSLPDCPPHCWPEPIVSKCPHGAMLAEWLCCPALAMGSSLQEVAEAAPSSPKSASANRRGDPTPHTHHTPCDRGPISNGIGSERCIQKKPRQTVGARERGPWLGLVMNKQC